MALLSGKSGEDLVTMGAGPIEDDLVQAAGKLALENPEFREIHDEFLVAVERVEMRSQGSEGEEADDDAAEFREDLHGGPFLGARTLLSAR
jgi:hypothetical protein